MADPNSNIILRRKYKGKAKLWMLYLKLLTNQMWGVSMAWIITKECRVMWLEPTIAMKWIKKYLKKIDGKRYELNFSEDILEKVTHFVDQYETLKGLEKKDKNIILLILIGLHYNDR